MKLKSLIQSIGGMAVILTDLLPVRALADTPAFANRGGWVGHQPTSFTGTKGWGLIQGSTFHSDDILITQLGVFDDGGDGLVNSHAVGLWTADGALLASTIVPAGTVASLGKR